MRLAETQAAFRSALLDPAASMPKGLGAPRPTSAERRFAVHRNNGLAGLADAVRSRFPAALAIVGDECFTELARRYVRARPPRSPVLLEYGTDFADFVEGFAAELALPYLADVLRLESAWFEAFHAADAAPAAPDALAALDVTTLADTRVAMHPAMRLVRSSHPLWTIWSMNVAGAEPRPVANWRGEDVLVARPLFDVMVQRLPPGGFAFLASLQAGATLGAATEAAFAAADDFDAASALAGLVTAGVATHFYA
jgi:hypothetical protein